MNVNYFTDAQVEIVATKVYGSPIEPNHFNDIKSIMNLAVETAIGKPVAYLVDGRINQSLFFDRASAVIMADTCCGEINFLYAVKRTLSLQVIKPLSQQD